MHISPALVVQILDFIKDLLWWGSIEYTLIDISRLFMMVHTNPNLLHHGKLRRRCESDLNTLHRDRRLLPISFYAIIVWAYYLNIVIGWIKSLLGSRWILLKQGSSTVVYSVALASQYQNTGLEMCLSWVCNYALVQEWIDILISDSVLPASMRRSRCPWTTFSRSWLIILHLRYSNSESNDTECKNGLSLTIRLPRPSAWEVAYFIMSLE